MNQETHIGDNGWGTIADYLDQHALEKVLLVTGKTMYVNSGAEAALTPVLANRQVRRVSEFDTNPKVEDVCHIVTELSEDSPYDVIIAVGGGSVMDISKLLKAFWTSDDPVRAFLSGKEPLEPADIPLIAVPSTAGSGSEATHFAVVYDGKTKYSIAHESLLPEMAVVIPSLLKSLPRRVAAASGMDALCQGIESYWSIHSTEASRELASEAIRLAWESLEGAVNDKQPSAMEQQARASHLAGRAINMTKTTAPHAVSYALTSFFGVAHGHAVGLLLPRFLQYNLDVTEADCLDPRGAQWVKATMADIMGFLGCNDVEQAVDSIYALMSRIGLEGSLKELGIMTEQDIHLIVENGFNPQRVNNNPRRLTKQALTTMLQTLVG